MSRCAGTFLHRGHASFPGGLLHEAALLLREAFRAPCSGAAPRAGCVHLIGGRPVSICDHVAFPNHVTYKAVRSANRSMEVLTVDVATGVCRSRGRRTHLCAPLSLPPSSTFALAGIPQGNLKPPSLEQRNVADRPPPPGQLRPTPPYGGQVGEGLQEAGGQFFGGLLRSH
ncbi:hypothetical protein MHYP_G00165160 [Metynnis hypsauchen]